MSDNYSTDVASATHIDVSYFAAGILANLLDCGPWTFEPTSDYCNQSLVRFSFYAEANFDYELSNPNNTR